MPQGILGPHLEVVGILERLEVGNLRLEVDNLEVDNLERLEVDKLERLEVDNLARLVVVVGSLAHLLVVVVGILERLVVGILVVVHILLLVQVGTLLLVKLLVFELVVCRVVVRLEEHIGFVALDIDLVVVVPVEEWDIVQVVVVLDIALADRVAEEEDIDLEDIDLVLVVVLAEEGGIDLVEEGIGLVG